MKILVTGATGFIGGEIVEMLAKDKQINIEATGRSNTNRFIGYTNVTYFQQDLCVEIPLQNCDVCIHSAGLADDQSTEEEFYRNNIEATENLLKALTNCKLFIYISSASVYDFSDGKIKTEMDTSHTKKISLYGKSKLYSEKIVLSSPIKSVYILRPRAVYGKGDRVLLPRILKLIKKNKMIVPSKLSTKTSLTHIQNICEVVNKSIKQSKPGKHIYNVADKVEYDLKTVFSEILYKKTGAKKIIQIPFWLVKLLVGINKVLGRKTNFNHQSIDYISQNSTLSLKRIEQDLGYQGKCNFLESIDQLDI